FKLSSDQFFLKSPVEMAAALPEYPDALENTLRVAEMCNVEFDFSKRYAPVFVPPANKSADEHLRELAYEGALRRYGGGGWVGDGRSGRWAIRSPRSSFEDRFDHGALVTRPGRTN